MREVGRAVQEILCPDEVIALRIAIAESGQRIPIVRIFATDLQKNWCSLVATTFFLQQKSIAHAGVSKVSCNWRIVRRKFVRRSEDSQIVSPLLLLGKRQGR